MILRRSVTISRGTIQRGRSASCASCAKKCLGLADLPERFPLVPRYEAKGVRRRGHGNYLIFCRVEVEKVVIVHILHGAQDYGTILFPS